MNAWRAPKRIRERHGTHEFGKLGADRRSTRSPAARLPGPESAEALPVPANHGLGPNDMERVAPPRPLVGVESHTQKRRSRRPNCGRFDRRRSRTSCCRSARFSSARSMRVLSDARSAPNRAITRDIASLARTPLGHRPAFATGFWQTTTGRNVNRSRSEEFWRGTTGALPMNPWNACPRDRSHRPSRVEGILRRVRISGAKRHRGSWRRSRNPPPLLQAGGCSG